MRRLAGLIGLVVLTVTLGIAAACADDATASGGSNSNNDVILHDTGDSPDFVEYFKQDGSGSKNYLYTQTSHPLPALGSCDFWTIASETGIVVVCVDADGQISVGGAGSSQ